MCANLVPTEEQIETLRDLFFKKLEREGAPFEDGLDERDINRVRNSNIHLQNFLEQFELNMKLSLQMLWDSCIWRKVYGTNDINETNVNQQLLYSGSIFSHSKDVDGKTLLIFKIKLFGKGKFDGDEYLRVIVYWLERLRREHDDDQLTLVYDMQSAGWSNLDLSLTKRIIDLFIYYYPNAVNYIIIYDIPWFLSAAIKIIKGFMPPKAIAQMKFVNNQTVTDYIDEKHALKSWGGQNDYEFSFVPEKLPNEERPSNNINNNNNNYQIINTNTIPTDMQTISDRKVHFANSSPPDSPMSELSQATLTEKAEGELLRISPEDAIIFTKSGNELVGTVDIVNISPGNVTYKIKTTSPEKFRVRPSSGCLSPGANTTISVVLQQGQSVSSLSKDKFLVMSMVLTAEIANNSQAIADLWKNTPAQSPLVEQRRLKCTLPQQMAPGDGLKNGRLDSNSFGTVVDSDRQFSSMLSQLTETTARLENQIKFSQNLQWITLCVFLLLSMAIVYILKQEINQSASGACTHSEL